MDPRTKIVGLRNAIRHQSVSIAITAFVFIVVCILMTGVTFFTNEVYIFDGSEVKYVLTTDEDADTILENNGYKLNEGDKVSFEGFKNNSGIIKINRAFVVPVIADGKTVEIPIAEGTVSDVLEKANIEVGDDDLINLGFNEKVNASTEIIVQRVTYDTIITDTAIPYSTLTTTSANMSKSVSVVKTEGQNGNLRTVVENTYIDGVVSEANVISETVTKDPVQEVIVKGTANKTPVSTIAPSSFKLGSNGLPTSYLKVFSDKKSSRYSARSGAGTASGRYKAGPGYIAVNPNIIPYGTKMYIVSSDGRYVYGYAIAADTGGFVNNGSGKFVDLYVPSNTSQSVWGMWQGVVDVDIYILEWGK